MEFEKINEGEVLIDFGFRDITTPLKDGTLEYIKKYDIIKRVAIEKEEKSYDKEHTGLYSFSLEECGIEGRIFPFDELVRINNHYNIIIQNYHYRIRRLYIDAQIFHDFKKGEEIPVRVSRKDFEKDPSFKLFNRIGGFIKDSGSGLCKRIEVGSKVLVKVENVWTNYDKIHIFTKPIEFLEDEKGR